MLPIRVRLARFIVGHLATAFSRVWPGVERQPACGEGPTWTGLCECDLRAAELFWWVFPPGLAL